MRKSIVGAVISCAVLVASVILITVTLGNFAPLKFTANQGTVAGVDTVKSSDGSVLHYAIRLEGHTATLNVMPAYMADASALPPLAVGDVVTFHLDSFYQSHYEADSFPHLLPSSLSAGDVTVIPLTLMEQHQTQMSALIRTVAICTAVLSAALAAFFTVRYSKRKTVS